MKTKTIQRRCLAAVLGLAILLPSAIQAGGNGQVVRAFAPAKSTQEIEQLKTGDTIAKVCRACGAVTLVRVEKGGKGFYDSVAKKCEDCGSENTYLAVAKQTVPFKEQVKH
ncbi:MAG: hypothetical protein U1F98_01505 [Verrucomicrobiota bacterium]